MCRSPSTKAYLLTRGARVAAERHGRDARRLYRHRDRQCLGGWPASDVHGRPAGLPDEVRLMGATAPPRMPLVPETDAPDQAEDEGAA